MARPYRRGRDIAGSIAGTVGRVAARSRPALATLKRRVTGRLPTGLRRPLAAVAAGVRRAGWDTWRFDAGLAPYGSDRVRRRGTADLDRLIRRHGAMAPRTRPDRLRRAVRHLEAVIDTVGPEPADRARMIAGVAAAGTPVVVTEPATLGDRLPPAVLATMTGLDPATLGDRSIAWRQWCAVFDHDLVPAGPGQRPSRLASRTMSVLVVTHRPAMIERWAPQLAAQNRPGLEAVVALHGDGFDADHRRRITDHLRAAGITHRLIDVAAEIPLGEALATAATAARGDLVVKWDDDDLYARGHLRDLERAWAYSGAMVVGKAADFIYLEGRDVTVRRDQAGHEIFSPTLSGATLCIGRADLARIGGWPPVATAEDAALVARVRAAGGRSYRMMGFGFIAVRRADVTSHTWQITDDDLVADGAPFRPGLALEWAMVDLPDGVAETLGRPAS